MESEEAKQQWEEILLEEAEKIFKEAEAKHSHCPASAAPGRQQSPLHVLWTGTQNI
ncbi:MAG: hypothetical protein U5K72_02215 [Balneolaceae bacterium]|nr:hypothetical protein [Balneolaceae bacterium]